MKLLRELSRLQAERGYLDEDCLRDLARRENVPLYRLQGLVSFYPHFRRTPPPRAAVHVCRDLSCRMAGGAERYAQLKSACDAQSDFEIHEVSCLGRCERAPAASLNDAPISNSELDTFLEDFAGSPLPNLSPVTTAARDWKCDPYSDATHRYGTVQRFLSDAEDIPQICIERLQQSKLKGMGGAGFPTGLKWELVSQETEPVKYVICNADESEPGTFKDRVILEHLPHLIIEGMLLAALTIGAEQGIVYIRHEYGPEREKLQTAINDAYNCGILGANVAGSGRKFDIEIFVSPGGYILGEETALLEALEDKRGEPRIRPPYPGTHGLWGKPTLINNVETFALATSIIAQGNDWWQAQGAGDYAGLKFFSISGDVAEPGVYEVPHGITIAELIARAGGLKDDRPLKAVLPGGASSNFLPAEHIDTPLDFDALRNVGSMLGSGAVVVIAEGRNLFDLGVSITRFFRNESCGKCVPCRIGTEKAVRMLEQVQSGDLDAASLEIMPELSETLLQTSICGLGQVALGPMNSVLERFPQDVPAGKETP